MSRRDLDLERRFVAGLSARTGYQRLLSGRSPTPGELERWTDVDQTREIALVAVRGEGDGEQLLGVARCVVDQDEPSRWDFAIVLADAWQGKGLGKILLQHLIQCADERGVPVLSSIVLAENHRMLALARALGFTVRREPGGATVVRIERRASQG
ncbi:MAG TPA: GNAT family N-acetyltransferase [Vicinamibacterales bacterium]|nr:GNAT family N-acetyltransferase [Vicinamibacterales bacterium]